MNRRRPLPAIPAKREPVELCSACDKPCVENTYVGADRIHAACWSGDPREEGLPVTFGCEGPDPSNQLPTRAMFRKMWPQLLPRPEYADLHEGIFGDAGPDFE